MAYINTTNRPRLRIRAWTLLELLVAITILLLLMALLSSTWSKFIDRADRAGCQSNLRELIRAMNHYAVAREGYYPGPTPVSPLPTVSTNQNDWGLGPPMTPKNISLGTRLAGFTDVHQSPDGQLIVKALTCPASIRAGHTRHYYLPTVKFTESEWDRVSGHASGYLTNNDGSLLPKRMTEIPNPSTTIYAMDIVANDPHNGMININFMDGQVISIPKTKLKNNGAKWWIDNTAN